MPDSLDRGTFLAEVASRLDLPDDLARELLDELAGHLDDATAALGEAGYAADDAERRAIRELGEPGLLGRELSRARHGRRQLLAAVGGGIRAAALEGLGAWIVIGLWVELSAMLSIPLAMAALDALGRPGSSYFQGAAGSLVAALFVASWFAYLGRLLPARVAPRAVRSARGMRVPVAIAGLVVGSAAVWLLGGIAVDPVLAVGLPLGPVVFAAAALRAPDRPGLRIGGLTTAVVAAGLVLSLVVLSIVAAWSRIDSRGWEADFSAIGDAPAADSVFNTGVTTSWQMGPPGDVSMTLSLDDAAPQIMARYPSLSVETWPAVNVNGIVRFGPAPLVSQRIATQPSTEASWSLPRLRDSVTTATFVVGITADGHRTVLAEDISLDPTPAWTGSLAEYWFGS